MRTSFTRSERFRPALAALGLAAFGAWLGLSASHLREARATATNKPSFTFRFRPPDGTTFVQTLVMTRTTEVGEQMRRTDITTSKTRVTIRKSPRGYTLVATPISATMTRDGAPVSSPVLSALTKLAVTYEIDTAGKIVAVRGYEKAAEVLQASAPPSAAAAMSRVLNKETLVRREKAEWNGRVGRYVGRTARPGDSWVSTDQFPLPDGGTAVFHSATRFDAARKSAAASAARARPGPGRTPLVRMKFRYDTDAEALGKLVGKTLRDLPRKAGGPGADSRVSDVEITGSGERLVDPATMLIYEETSARTMRMKMEFPGQGRHRAVSQEKRVYRYDYQSG